MQNLLNPTLDELAEAHSDVTGPAYPVEITISHNGIVWVNIGPVCLLRICRTAGVTVHDNRTPEGE